MDFRNMTVKQLLSDPEMTEVVKRYAPQIFNYPVRMVYARRCGEVIDRAVSAGLISKAAAEKIGSEINKIIR